MSTRRYRVPVARIGRVLAAVVATAVAVFWLRCVFIVIRSRFSTGFATDPHGYELIAGTLMSVPSAAVVTLCAPFAFPPHLRPRVFRIITPILLVTTGLVYVLFFTA
ncbi:hypothetical protein [Nocardia sp. NPDC003345]